MLVISNSSPIIHLTKIGRLELLKNLYGQILVPTKVYSECTDTTSYRAETHYISSATWISIVQIENLKLFNLLYSEIDAGEAEAIVLSLERSADLVLLDDMEARMKARRLELRIAGTLGVLLKAKKSGLVQTLPAEIQKLEESGFWMSSNIKDKILNQS